MAPTYYSMSTMSSGESWRAIRTIRAEPEGPLADVLDRDSARRREFHMALEQAQQQFSAAERIGYESRPLNLFYGLSQAGRAIAAGSRLLGEGTGQRWQASGHGLKFDVGLPRGLFVTPVRLELGARDLFSRVSTAIGSPLDFNTAEFGAVINQLIDYTITFGDTDGFARPITDVHVYNVQSKSFPLEVEVPVPGFTTAATLTLDDVRGRFARYPALVGLEIALNDTGEIKWSHNEGRCFVVVNGLEQLTVRGGGGVADLKGSTSYRRLTALLPRISDSDQTLSPLMTWWLVLYALSMLARYSPSQWTETLSLADSRIASRIESLLDSALDAVPELIWGELYYLGNTRP